MRVGKAEQPIRDAVADLLADLPKKLRKHEGAATAAFLNYVDPMEPFPLVYGAAQEQRRVCRTVCTRARARTTRAYCWC